MSIPSIHIINDPTLRITTNKINPDDNIRIYWPQNLLLSDPLYRVVHADGSNHQVEPFPNLFGYFFEEFFRGFELWRGENFGWASELSSVLATVRSYVQRSLATEHSLLYPHSVAVREIPLSCQNCDWNFPCLLCEHAIQHLFILSKAERARGQQLDLLREVLPRRLPVPVLHLVSDFVSGDPWRINYVKDVVLYQIAFVQQRLFTPEILSIVTRETFLVWAWAFIDGRLGQFYHRPFFESNHPHNPTGDYPDYDTYLLRAYPCNRDFEFWHEPNILRCLRCPLRLTPQDIEEAYI
jgi:hypothetical protein